MLLSEYLDSEIVAANHYINPDTLYVCDQKAVPIAYCDAVGLLVPRDQDDYDLTHYQMVSRRQDQLARAGTNHLTLIYDDSVWTLARVGQVNNVNAGLVDDNGNVRPVFATNNKYRILSFWSVIPEHMQPIMLGLEDAFLADRNTFVSAPGFPLMTWSAARRTDWTMPTVPYTEEWETRMDARRDELGEETGTGDWNDEENWEEADKVPESVIDLRPGPRPDPLHLRPAQVKRQDLQAMGVTSKKNDWQRAGEESEWLHPGQKWWARNTESRFPRPLVDYDTVEE